jgi:subtilase family serine protease
MFFLSRRRMEARPVISPREARPGQRLTFRPRLEELEPRLAPSADLLGNLALSNPIPHVQVVKTNTATAAGLPGQPLGFSPQQISQAYNFNHITFNGGAIKGDGSGQTIAIVDPYSQPHIVNDLQTFDSTFGLSAPPTFTVVNQYGGTTLPAADATWGLEESLDVEWAHALAPGAKILLVEANSTNWPDLLAAVNYARNQPGVSVISLSWGGGEGADEAAYDSYFTTPSGHNGITFVAASGDGGSQGTPLYPSVSPNVLAVGGTRLGLNSSGNYGWETGWSGSGGGISLYESRPGFQKNIVTQSGTGRAVPDVAYNASTLSPYAVYDSWSYSGWLTAAGTSAGAPQWAALLAIADQGRALNGQSSLDGATQTLPALYQLPSSDFHDIYSGSNGAYSASPGYDLVTGRGSPVADKIVSGLVSYGTNISTASAPWLVSPASASPSVVTSKTTRLSVLGGDDSGAASLTYTWSALSGPASAPLPTYSINGTNSAQKTQATFYKAGTYVLRATIEDSTGKTISSDVSVTVAQTLTSIAITPSNPNVADGSTLQFHATAKDQFGAVMNRQPSWTWKLASGVGSLSSVGLYSAPATGTGQATVQATGGGLTGSTSLTVGPTPAAPSNLNATVFSSHQVNLRWQDHSSNETGFILQRSRNGGSWTTLTKVGANVTTFSDTTVYSGATFSYRVCAYNSFGDSAFSNTTGSITTTTTGSTLSAVQPQLVWSGKPTPFATRNGFFSAQKDDAASGRLIRSIAETFPSEALRIEATIWLAWSSERMQNAFNPEFLRLLDALWYVWI